MLIKRGDTYYCKWTINKKPFTKTTGTKDKAEAQEFHDRLRSELWRETKLGDTPTLSWDEAALSWVEDHAIDKRSYEDDRLRLVWLTKELTGKPITEIKTDTLFSLRKKRVDLGNAPATANRYLAVVSAVLNFARERDKLAATPAIPYFPEDSGEFFLWITRAQAKKLIKELPPHLAAMTRFALATGLRRHNITHLEWQNISLEREVMWVWGRTAKGKRHISVKLTREAVQVLKEQQGRHPVYVFVYVPPKATVGAPVHRTTTKAWEKAIARAGIDPAFTFHDLRHTWASWHVMAGTPLEALQVMGAWRSLDMVMRYAHLDSGYVAQYAANASFERSAVPKNVYNHDAVSGDYHGNAL